MRKPELLAPCGNMDCLKAAIKAGCDAVYLAGKLFGARSFAGNFDNEQLKEAIEYSHLYGVKVYITVNTIIYEREVERFIDFIRFIYKAGCDAVIMQDLGMIDLVRKKFPKLEVHASTQVNIHNYEGALLAKKLGIKRVVMARETSYEVIKKIKEELDIEVEVFVHGALCISYSGQCLMSALIGNRSGNRGTCAQVCRKSYDLYDLNNNKLNTDNYLLSTKDLNTLQNIDKLIEIGVDSLKIEGRMKRKEYVYLVVSIYRKAIDNYFETGKINISKKDMLDLEKIFNRCFTKGFMFNENNNDFVYQKRPNHKGVLIGKVVSKINNDLKIKLYDTVNLHDGLRIIDEKEDKGIIINKMFINNKEVISAKKDDVITIKYDKYVKPDSDVLLTSDYNKLNEIDNILNDKKTILIDIYAEAMLNNKLYLKATDGINTVEIYSEFLIEEALKMPTSKKQIEIQLKKCGDTIYSVNNIDIIMDDNIFINIRDINDLRRRLLKLLDEKRLYLNKFEEKEYSIDLPSFENEKKSSILLNTKEDYLKYKNEYNLIYTENKSLLENNDVVLKLPRVINNYEDNNNKVLIGELGSILKYKEFDTDFSFNVVNSYTLAFLHSIGAKKVTLSYELNTSSIKLLIDNYIKRYNKKPNCEVIIDSYPEAMISKFDLNKMYGVNISYLVDEFKNKYKVVSDNEFMRIYNFEKKIFKNKEELYSIGVNYLRKNV